MLRIWGRLASINVRKVVWAAREVGVEHERIDAGGPFGGIDTPAFGAMNPNRMVPVIDDDGFCLWESNVIVRYLCARYAAGRLYPEELAARFDAERWMDWQQTTLNPAGRGAFRHWFRTPEGARQPKVLAESIVETEPLMALVDGHLATRRFMTGDQFTMADIPIACEVHRWVSLPIDQVARPNLDRWYQTILSREGARGIIGLPLS